MNRATAMLRASVFMQRRNNYLFTLTWAAFVLADAAVIANPAWLGI